MALKAVKQCSLCGGLKCSGKEYDVHLDYTYYDKVDEHITVCESQTEIVDCGLPESKTHFLVNNCHKCIAIEYCSTGTIPNGYNCRCYIEFVKNISMGIDYEELFQCPCCTGDGIGAGRYCAVIL